MNFKLLLFLILFSIICQSCIQELEVFSDNEKVLVIDGEFTNEYKPHKIRIYYATGFNKISEFIENADVTINTLSGFKEHFVYEQYGFYSTNPHYNIGADHDELYYLQVTLNDGETYRSDTVQLPAAITPVSEVSHHRSSDGENVILTANFKDDPYHQNNYRFKWRGVYQSYAEVIDTDCFVPTLNLEQLYLSDDLFYNGQFVENIPIGNEPYTIKFNYGYLFRVQTQNLSRKDYNYWSSVRNQIDNNGTIFETQNFRIQGNIRNTSDQDELVLGNFTLAYATEPTVHVIYDYVNTFLPRSCIPDRNTGRYPPKCTSCSAYSPFATSERPPDWQ